MIEPPRPGIARRGVLAIAFPGLIIAAGFCLVAFLAGGLRADPDTLAVLLETRVNGCPICAGMVENVTPHEFHDDAHDFACADCHHPHTRRSAEEWRLTCQSSECHPRAWTRSIFHRIDPETFLDCRNCHGAHVWTVDGSDCASCHSDLEGFEGIVETPSVDGVDTFAHGIHGAFPCATCHESQTRHAKLTMTESSQCMDCHHRGDHGTECASCHGGALAIPERALKVDLEMSVWTSPRERALPFDHARHKGLQCEACHDSGSDYAPIETCASCHDQHHTGEAGCVTCHTTPADGAHALAVHETRTCSGSGCHSAGFETMPLQRNFCVACHQDQSDHMAGKNCAGCHKLQPDPVGLEGRTGGIRSD